MAKFFTIQAPGSLTVDREKRRINGVAIATKGNANGDTIDDDSIKMFAALGAAGQIRARFDHPNRADPREIEQTLDNLLGEHVNFRIDGDVVRADCQFAGVNLEKENKVLDLADKAPHLFGVSVVFDEMPLPKGKKPKKNDPCRPAKLYAGDFVDIPAANAAGLFAAKAAEREQMDPADVYAKDGKFYCMVEGKEIPLKHSKEAVAALQDDDDDEPDKDAAKKKAATLGNVAAPDAAATADDITKAKTEAIEGERAYRKMFATVVKSAGLKDKDAEEFEDTFYGQDEKVLKFMASRAIGTRAKPVGEGSGAAEGKATGEKTDVQKAEESAGERFDSEPQVRSMYGANLRDPASNEWKSARGRHVAAARNRFLNGAK